MQQHWHTDTDALRAHGFTGFLTIRALRDCKLSSVPGDPGDIGVYVVFRQEDGVPTFLEKSTGGRFKGLDPNVAREILEKHWIHKSPIVYVGKAGSPDGAATLRSRLRQYLAFGAGRRIGHWGGRYIWHLPTSENLIICWKKTPGEVPRVVEQQLIQEFSLAHGARPFANLVD
jgi:hypothetical protein